MDFGSTMAMPRGMPFERPIHPTWCLRTGCLIRGSSITRDGEGSAEALLGRWNSLPLEERQAIQGRAVTSFRRHFNIHSNSQSVIAAVKVVLERKTSWQDTLEFPDGETHHDEDLGIKPPREVYCDSDIVLPCLVTEGQAAQSGYRRATQR